MIHTIIYMLLFAFCLLYSSCKKENAINTHTVLNVDLKDIELSPSTLFNKIEIIPLETKDESLITSIGRIREYNNKYYILDDRISVLYCFDKTGNFLYKIDKNENDPESYHLVYETVIDGNRDCVYMLSPMGFIHVYDINGNFIEKHNLPEGGGEQDMIQLDENTLAYWKLMGDKTKNKVTFYDLNKKKIIGGFWKDTEDTFMSNMCIDVFYKYDNMNFFSTQYANEVYQFDRDTIKLVYQ